MLKFWLLSAVPIALTVVVLGCNGGDGGSSGETTTASGLTIIDIEEGSGEAAQPGQTVAVHYTGWHTNGEMFDSSVARRQPATFPLNRVIAGWTEGVQLMVVGEKRRFWIPSDLGYGDRGYGDGVIPPGAELVFDIELLAIK